MERLDGVDADLSEEIKNSLHYAHQAAEQAKSEASEAKSAVNKLSHQLDELKYTVNKLSVDNNKLKRKIVEQEAYSRRNNLIIRGIPEDPQDLLHKVHYVMGQMGHPHPPSVPIEKLHRIGPVSRPINGNGPRNVIVRFKEISDRDEMYKYRQTLKNVKMGGNNIFIEEDLPQEIQNDRDYLMPIYLESKKMQKFRDSKIVQDKLIIGKQTITKDNLIDLPDELKPEKVSSRENNTTFIWFSQLSPLSNFAHYPITVQGKRYTCNEQFIQSQKAEMANDFTAVRRIMQETSPKRMKALGRSVRVQQAAWEQRLGEILRICNWEKYTHHEKPRQYLLATADKKLGEAKIGPAGIGYTLRDRDALNSNLWNCPNLMGKCLTDIRAQLK